MKIPRLTLSTTRLYRSIYIQTAKFKEQCPGLVTDITTEEEVPVSYEEIIQFPNGMSWDEQKRNIDIQTYK